MATLRPPRGLSRPERQLWLRTAKDNPHLKPSDATLLTTFCRLSVALDHSLDRVAKAGTLAVSKTGGEYLSPAAQVAFALSNRVVRLAAQLKVTPATRPAKPPAAEPPEQPPLPQLKVMG